MKKISRFIPLAIPLYIPIWYSCVKFKGSFTLLISVLKYKGLIPLIIEVYTFSFPALFYAILFYVLIKNIAPSISLLITSIGLLSAYYLFFSPKFLYNELGIFLLLGTLELREKTQSRNLFFLLFFITLLHSYSCLQTSTLYYGYNTQIILSMIIPISCLIALLISDVYPSVGTIVSIFPISLLPLSYFVHNMKVINIPMILYILISAISVFNLLHKRSYKTIIPLLLSSIGIIFFIDQELILPFIATPISLTFGIIQLFYASRCRQPFHKPSLQHPKQLFLPSLHFYNEHMHY